MSTSTLEREHLAGETEAEEMEVEELRQEDASQLFARKIETPNLLRLTDLQLSAENPRLNFDPDKLDELTESIRLSGVLQPILVWKTPAPSASSRPYTVIAGERRYRAAEKAGLTEIPVVVSKARTAEDAYVESVMENVQREGFGLMEMAHIYNTLMERKWSQERIAKEVHGGKVSIGVISNTGRLTKLPAPVQTYFQDGKLTLSHGILLLKALDRTHASPHLSTHQEAPVIELAEECLENGWTTKSLDFEVERRFPKPKEAALPLEMPQETQEARFALPGPTPNPLHPDGDILPGSSSAVLPDEFVSDPQAEMTDEEWDASARPVAPKADEDSAQDNAEEDSDASLHDHPAEASDPEPHSATQADPEKIDEDESDPQDAETVFSSPPAQREDAPVGSSDAPKPAAAPAQGATPQVAPPKITESKAAEAVTSTPIAQPVGTVSHVVLLSQETDDWLWEHDLTALAAIELLKVIWPLRLTTNAEYAAKALTRQFNEEHSGSDVTIADRIESILVVRAGNAGLWPNDNYKNLEDYKENE